MKTCEAEYKITDSLITLEHEVPGLCVCCFVMFCCLLQFVSVLIWKCFEATRSTKANVHLLAAAMTLKTWMPRI